ncbi:signal peptidase I [Streptomyces thermolineatus]|uniref:Signal peptidase I n=1 Tax=Streptomyces thermolineatus TaxID=44033 RepID=A0ABN3LYL3_9ACTN
MTTSTGTSGATTGPRSHPPGPRPGRGRLGGILSNAAVAVGTVLFLGGFAWGAVQYQPVTVPSGSMDPTLEVGDRVLAQRIDGEDVRRGDVVIFNDSLWGDVPMVKRVVAVGGDTVQCCDKRGRLIVNGESVDEPYLEGEASAVFGGLKKTEVEEGSLFLLGDDRATSVDSRMHLTDDNGGVPREAVSARVDARAWPPGRMGGVERTTAFDDALGGGVSAPGPYAAVTWAIVGGAALVLGGAAHGPVTRMFGRA